MLTPFAWTLKDLMFVSVIVGIGGMALIVLVSVFKNHYQQTI